MLNKLKTQREGFTIIEVIIVLVIGAVIMLAVFLVVPQLQSSQRNTRRQNDARQLLSSIQQYASNNNGNKTTTANDLYGITGNLKDPNAPAGVATYSIAFGSSNPTSVNNITIAYGYKCPAKQGDPLVSSPTNNAVIVWTEGATKSYCVGD